MLSVIANYHVTPNYYYIACLQVIFFCRFHIPMSDEVAEFEANKDPLMMKAVKAFKANFVSPIQLRFT